MELAKKLATYADHLELATDDHVAQYEASLLRKAVAEIKRLHPLPVEGESGA